MIRALILYVHTKSDNGILQFKVNVMTINDKKIAHTIINNGSFDQMSGSHELLQYPIIAD